MWRASALVLATAAAITTLEAIARPDERLAVLLSGLFPAVAAPISWYVGPRLSARTSYNLGRVFLVLGAASAAVSMYQWRGTPVAGAMAFHMVLVVVFAAVFFDRRDVVQLVVVESALALTALLADGYQIEDLLAWIMMLLAVVGTGFVLSLSVQTSDLLSYGDPLTGAANRRAWDIVVAESVERHRRHRSALSVVLIDIDRFKSINDEYGHERGDEVLRAGVVGWRRVVRATDTIARLGGDEFGVLIPGVDHDMAVEIAGRLLEEFNRSTGATCSIGVATCPPGGSADDLVGEADRRLYEAKAAGRARVVTRAGASGP